MTGTLGYAYTKMPAVDKYKPNSIKNAIRYRFQIKAKYYRNLTVLEKASLLWSIIHSFPIRAIIFLTAVSPRLSTTRLTSHGEATNVKRCQQQMLQNLLGPSGAPTAKGTLPAPLCNLLADSCINYYLNSNINAKHSVKRWAFIAKSLGSLQ